MNQNMIIKDTLMNVFFLSQQVRDMLNKDWERETPSDVAWLMAGIYLNKAIALCSGIQLLAQKTEEKELLSLFHNFEEEYFEQLNSSRNIQHLNLYFDDLEQSYNTFMTL